MIRIITVLLTLAALIAAAFMANDAESLSFFGMLGAVVLIIGFAVGAADWTIRHDV